MFKLKRMTQAVTTATALTIGASVAQAAVLEEGLRLFIPGCALSAS